MNKKELREYMRRIAKRGGKAGRGKVKARTRAQLEHAIAARWPKRGEQ